MQTNLLKIIFCSLFYLSFFIASLLTPSSQFNFPSWVATNKKLSNTFKNTNFCLKEIRSGSANVPRIFLKEFPNDLKKLNHLDTKKDTFIQIMLPIILLENENIKKDRIHLIKLKNKEEAHSDNDSTWLLNLAKKYKMPSVNIETLLERVDIIPTSLALGQAIIESGWGTSYAALQKNSPFGMTIREKVKYYDTLIESSKNYINNLNTNNAYKNFRALRSQMREANTNLNSNELVKELIYYSEQKKLYISKVTNAITFNNLHEFDEAKLIKA